jgi:hypothetical protein
MYLLVWLMTIIRSLFNRVNFEVLKDVKDEIELLLDHQCRSKIEKMYRSINGYHHCLWCNKLVFREIILQCSLFLRKRDSLWSGELWWIRLQRIWTKSNTNGHISIEHWCHSWRFIVDANYWHININFQLWQCLIGDLNLFSFFKKGTIISCDACQDSK